MRKNKETINKYLAGLVDADGTITVCFYKSKGEGWKPSFILKLYMSLEDKHAEETMLWLFDEYKYGSIQRTDKAGLHKDSKMISWAVTGDNAISIVNRFIKHSVIKGQHAIRMMALVSEYKGYGNTVKTEDKLKELKTYVKWSRDNTGPIKPKKHLTWAWLAGYTDGDGYIGFNEDTGNCALEYNCHERDIEALKLISKATGRSITYNRGYPRIRHYIGRRTRNFAYKILKPMLTHLRLKKWKAEQVLRIIRRD